MSCAGRVLPERRFTALVLLLAAAGAVACDPFRTGFDDVEPGLLYEARTKTPAPAQPSTLKVLNWNIKYGGGRISFFWECHGDRYTMTRAEVMHNLKRVAAKIRELDPDVVLLQEVDLKSTRSAYVDQLQYLLDHTSLNYGAYASQHKADFVPSDGLGRMEFGNALMSRWPLRDATRIALALREEDSALTRYFYLKRNVLRAQVEVPGLTDFFLVDVHAEAFSKDGTKRKHIDSFKEVLDELDAAGATFVGGGDLNALPPGSPRTAAFPDEVDCQGRFGADDYTGEEDWLQALYDTYPEAIPLADYQADPEAFYSYTGDESVGWTRRLDYLFTNGGFVARGVMHHEAISLSDHTPVVVELAIP